MQSDNPISISFNAFPIKIVGLKNFVALRDIAYLIINRNDPTLQPHRAKINTLMIRTINTGIATTFSAFVLNGILLRFAINRFRLSNFNLLVIDMLWYSAAAYAFLHLAASPMKDTRSDYFQIKTNLIKTHNPGYLAHLLDN